jgi:hypothetical protein
MVQEEALRRRRGRRRVAKKKGGNPLWLRRGRDDGASPLVELQYLVGINFID